MAIKARDSITIASNSVGGRNLIQTNRIVRGVWLHHGSESPSNICMSTGFISVKPGDSIILQYWQPQNNNEGDRRAWSGNILYFDADKHYVSGYINTWFSNEHMVISGVVPSDCYYVRATYQLPSNSEGINAYNWNQYSSYKWKLELGNIATDWTPAPEDVDSAISTAQSTADTAKSNAATAQSTANNAQKTADAAKKKIYHSATGTNGTAGYVGFCTIKVKQNYANMPILFTLQNRGGQSSNVSFLFKNQNNTDPGLGHVQRDGGIGIWAYKSDTSTWILIAQKSEAYDMIYVTDYSNPWESRFTVTWTNTHYSSLPAPNITAATLLAGKINKSVVDDAAKTATNYLYQDRTNGLVVGYKDGSGNWAAARSQMKSDGFYVIRKDGTEVGHFKDSEVLIGQSSGRNVLIDNDSVDIRNGSKVLSSFTSDAIYLGKNSDSSVIDISNNAGTLRGSIDSNNKKKFNILSENEIHIKTSDNLVIDCMHASEIHSRIDMQSRSPSIMNLYSTTPGGMSMVSIGDTSIDISSTYNATNKECNIELNEGNININGQTTINSPASVLIGGSNDYTYSLRLGDTYTKACSINTVWADGNVHDLISRASNGISSYYGPASFSDKHTTTNIRGYTVRLYNHGGGTYLGSSGSTAITSDRNLKRDIYDVDDKYIDFFSKLRPVSYKYNAKENIGHRDHIGYIAQEVEEALLSSGLTTEQFAGICIENDVDLDFNYDSSLTEEEIEANKVHYDKLYSLRYEEFIALNTHMIQKCLSKIEDTQKEIDELKATISDLTSKINNKEE